ncbi:CLUMA_CG018181, isoform A [Clunio marinus]|uniref:CLUMA_CG018181, isoform A n=1 Tax=Clunio marinus TaxID=568069 RepID=A0A1J1J288_9DIPT|nr:CLUMA_CG018181, isoform A [Clunio marinus]
MNQSNPQILKETEQNLSSWEKEPNFYRTILNFYSNLQLDEGVRYMAILTLKNGIDRHWRKTQASAINPEEKSQIKSQLLSNFNEPRDQLAVQFAVTISKIARLDCPNDWPELMPILIARINSTNELEQKRSIQVLVQVVKQLSTRRLHHDRMMFEEFTSNIFEFCVNLWNGFTMFYFQNIQRNDSLATCQSNLEKAMMMLRILRKLTIYGFPKSSQAQKPINFLKNIFERIKDLLECRLRIKSSPFDFLPLLERHEKFVLKHMKVLTEFQEHHRLVFMEFAPQVLEMSFNYVFFEGSQFIFDNNQLTMPNFVIHCLNLIKSYLLNSTGNIYIHRPTEVEDNLSDLLKNFFTQERLGYIMEKLLMHYFLLTPSDIEQWEDDPEAYVTDEGGDSWKYSLRSCTETFLTALFRKYPSILCQQLVVFIQKSQSIQLTESSDVNDILIKESIYNAAGLTAFHLFDDVDFDAWFTSQLVHELKIQGSNFRVLRKRIIWMVGQWTGVKFSKDLRPMVYESCLELLQPTEDLVIRLTASKTLRIILDDFDFCAEQFLEFLEPSFTLLFLLLKESKECDTKMNVLYVMSFIVEKMSMSIKIQADNLVSYLPMLWEEGVAHNMLRVAIISALLQIIKAIYELPESTTPFIYQVIEMSTNVNDPSTVYLLEEGLELWLVVIQYTSSPNEALFKLCGNLLPIIESSTMNLKTCLLIMQAYMLLCPELYVQKYGKELVATCQYLLNDIRTEGIVIICKLFITMIKVHSDFAIELLHPVMIDILKHLLSNSDYLTTTQTYLQVVTRYFLANQHALSCILEELQIEDAFKKLLKIWLDTMPSVIQNEDKKLLAIGLCSLLTVPNNVIMENFSVIIINIFETLCDIMKSDSAESAEVDSLVLADASDDDYYGMNNDMEDFEHKTPHFERYKGICLKDPVHVIVLKDCLQSQSNLFLNKLYLLIRTVNTKMNSNFAQQSDPGVDRNIDIDYLYALQLHKELNGLEAEEAMQIQRQKDIQDTNKVLQLMDGEQQGESSSIVNGISLLHHNHENSNKSQYISQQVKRTSPEEYYLPSLKTFINLNNSQEWKEISIEPNVSFIFSRLRSKFFCNVRKVRAYTISWSESPFSDSSNFTINPNNRTIQLNRDTLLICDRIHFISVLFHILIHCSVYETSQSSTRRIYNHDSNYLAIMKFFNENLELEIGTNHTFIRSVENKTDRYHCIGECCSSDRSFSFILNYCLNQQIYTIGEIIAENHKKLCSGRFHKIFEAVRVYNNVKEIKYVINRHYEDPKVNGSNVVVPEHNSHAIAHFDLTNEEHSHNVKSLVQVIDLDDEEFTSPHCPPRKIVEVIKNNFNAEACPICESSFMLIKFIKHINFCTGIKIH